MSAGSGGGGGGASGRSRLHHKRRPGNRRNTQHNVATVEPICDMRKVVNGVVAVDQDKLNKLVHQDPIDLHYAVEAEPFASGLFATVRKCRHRTTGVEYAAKYATKLRYGQDCTTEILHEIALMSMCTTNPRIIHLIDVFDTPTHMILVMEYAPGGDLQTLMDDDMVPYEKDAVKFVRQVLEGLLFLHERSMAHLDIKLQNVLLMGTFPDCDVKLCDLEISRIIVAGQEVRELLGTPDYVSPEILHYEPITLSADIWSVGVMAYVLLTGFTPFGGDTDQETFHNICHGQLDFPDELFEDISSQAVDFIRKTLSRDPSCRPTVRECLKHPWLTAWRNVASHQRETISSESQRKTSALNNASGGVAVATLACPRSASAAASINGHQYSSSSASNAAAAARSLQRAMSKSREVLYERVAASNLRKSTSKSRERLCEMRLSVSRSRDHLCDLLQPSVAQSRERLHSLRNFSKSHEVLSLLSDARSQTESASASHQAPSSLIHILPLTQSLERFSTQPLSATEANPLAIEPLTPQPPSLLPTQPTVQRSVSATESLCLVDLCGTNLSESTETLCDERENSSQPEVSGEEVTPCNSRPETPTTRQNEVAHPLAPISQAVVRNQPKSTSRDSDTAAVRRAGLVPTAVVPAAPQSGLGGAENSNARGRGESSQPTSQRCTDAPVYSWKREPNDHVLNPAPAEQQSHLSVTPSANANMSPWNWPSSFSTESSTPRTTPLVGRTAPLDHAFDSSIPGLSIRKLLPVTAAHFVTTPTVNTATIATPVAQSAPAPLFDSTPKGSSDRLPPADENAGTCESIKSSDTLTDSVRPAQARATDPPRLTAETSQQLIQTETQSNKETNDGDRRGNSSSSPTAATSTATSDLDTTSLSEKQRNLLPSVLNRRRASWAYGSKQDNVSIGAVAAKEPAAEPTFIFSGHLAKKAEPKLTVSELITNFNHGVLAATEGKHGSSAPATSAGGQANTGKMGNGKSLAVGGTIFDQDNSRKSTPTWTSASTPSQDSNGGEKTKYVDKERAAFKSVLASIQAYSLKSNPPSSVAAAATGSVLANSSAGALHHPRSVELPARSKPHHLSWDARALPRLPEDTVCSPSPHEGPSPLSTNRQSESDTTSIGKKSPVPSSVSETLTVNKGKESTKSVESFNPASSSGCETARMTDAGAVGFEARSGSVSSDTGCSSSSDLSDRSGDETIQDRTNASPEKKSEKDPGCSTFESVCDTGITTGPANWSGRPRSFSVQAEISFLAQPWNRVCTGSVARAFEKFGTKVEGDSQTVVGAFTHAGHPSQRSRRQSTPGPLK